MIRFKREFAEVAWAAFRTEILPEDMLAELDAAAPPAEQRYYEAMDEAAAMRRDLGQHFERLTPPGTPLPEIFIRPEQRRLF